MERTVSTALLLVLLSTCRNVGGDLLMPSNDCGYGDSSGSSSGSGSGNGEIVPAPCNLTTYSVYVSESSPSSNSATVMIPFAETSSSLVHITVTPSIGEGSGEALTEVYSSTLSAASASSTSYSSNMLTVLAPSPIAVYSLPTLTASLGPSLPSSTAIFSAPSSSSVLTQTTHSTLMFTVVTSSPTVAAVTSLVVATTGDITFSTLPSPTEMLTPFLSSAMLSTQVEPTSHFADSITSATVPSVESTFLSIGVSQTASDLGSLSVGVSPTASDLGSLSVGVSQTASDLGSLIVGVSPTVSDLGSLSVGVSQMASDLGSLSVGVNPTASDLGSLSVGVSQTAPDLGSLSVGVSQTAPDLGSLSVGVSQTASDLDSLSVGVSQTASDLGSLSIRVSPTASHLGSPSVVVSQTGSGVPGASSQPAAASLSLYVTVGASVGGVCVGTACIVVVIIVLVCCKRCRHRKNLYTPGRGRYGRRPSAESIGFYNFSLSYIDGGSLGTRLSTTSLLSLTPVTPATPTVHWQVDKGMFDESLAGAYDASTFKRVKTHKDGESHSSQHKKEDLVSETESIHSSGQGDSPSDTARVLTKSQPEEEQISSLPSDSVPETIVKDTNTPEVNIAVSKTNAETSKSDDKGSEASKTSIDDSKATNEIPQTGLEAAHISENEFEKETSANGSLKANDKIEETTTASVKASKTGTETELPSAKKSEISPASPDEEAVAAAVMTGLDTRASNEPESGTTTTIATEQEEEPAERCNVETEV